MYFSGIIQLLAAISLASAVAVPSNPPAKKCYVDNFDDLNGNPLGIGSVVGTYNGINYKGFSISGLHPVSALKLASSPNAIFANMPSDLLQLGDVTIYPYGYMVNNSAHQTFDVISFYFGCVITSDVSPAAVPQGCKITVCAYDPLNTNGVELPCATFEFKPDPKQLTNVPLQFALLPPTFSKAKKVVFGIAQADRSIIHSELVLDDVKHCNYP